MHQAAAAAIIYVIDFSLRETAQNGGHYDPIREEIPRLHRSGSPVTHPYAPTRSDFEEPGPLETAASHGSRLVCRPPQPAVRKRGGAGAALPPPPVHRVPHFVL